MKIKLFVLLCFTTNTDCCDTERVTSPTRGTFNEPSKRRKAVLQTGAAKAAQADPRTAKEKLNAGAMKPDKVDQAELFLPNPDAVDDPNWFDKYDTKDRAMSPETCAALQEIADRHHRKVTTDYSFAKY